MNAIPTLNLWYQLISSPRTAPHFIGAVQEHCDTVTTPGVKAHVHGTDLGGSMDQYAAVAQADASAILRIAHKEVAQGGYDAYAMGNCLDLGMDGLREILAVPVLSIMEVGCFLATTLGDRFGIVAPHDKMRYPLIELVGRYGLSRRLSSVEALSFSHVPAMDSVFGDSASGAHTVTEFQTLANRMVADGAEIILVPGPIGCFLARQGVTEAAGAVVLDMFAALAAVTESTARLARLGALRTSRTGRFQQPDAAALRDVFADHARSMSL